MMFQCFHHFSVEDKEVKMIKLLYKVITSSLLYYIIIYLLIRL